MLVSQLVSPKSLKTYLLLQKRKFIISVLKKLIKQASSKMWNKFLISDLVLKISAKNCFRRPKMSKNTRCDSGRLKKLISASGGVKEQFKKI